MRKSIAAALLAACALLGAAALRADGQAPPAGLHAVHDLARGAVLTLDDIDTGSTPASNARALVGWITRRVIHQGEALKAPAVAPAPMVQAGATVTIEAGAGGVNASRSGVAIGNGTLGEHVRVRVDAYRIVTAIITGPATVRLPSGDHR